MAKALSINGEASLRLFGRARTHRRVHKTRRTGIMGVNRLALTAADGEGPPPGRQMVQAGGIAGDGGQDRQRLRPPARAGRFSRPVLLGSHIDSVPTAGRFDGCLGVLGALEVVRTLERRARRRRAALSSSASSPMKRAAASAPTCWAAPPPRGACRSRPPTRSRTATA